LGNLEERSRVMEMADVCLKKHKGHLGKSKVLGISGAENVGGPNPQTITGGVINQGTVTDKAGLKGQGERQETTRPMEALEEDEKGIQERKAPLYKVGSNRKGGPQNNARK